MKKLLLGSVFLTFFAISITLFQASCQKEAIANTESTYTLPPATSTTLGGVIVGTGLNVTANGTISVTANGVNQQNKIIYKKHVSSVTEIWTANYDGSNQKKLSIALPSGASVWDMSISPDGQKLIFSAFVNSSESHIFTCNTDGSNLTKIIDGTGLGTEGLNILVAY
jgi:hypothetical protein